MIKFFHLDKREKKENNSCFIYQFSNKKNAKKINNNLPYHILKMVAKLRGLHWHQWLWTSSVVIKNGQKNKMNRRL